MAKLAIKGHETRGAEVIALLEMLGGINDGNLYGDLENAYYFIGNLNEIDAGYVSEHDNSKQYLLYSLEEFEKKFPYKVGDKVLTTHDVTNVYTITSMTWSGLRVAYKIRAFNGIDNVHEWFAYEMKPYKEQREEEIKQQANTRYSVSHPFIDIAKESFIEGAQWADKTMIDKACKWLKDNLFDYPWYDNDAPNFTIDDIINDFRKAMEE